jgi:hypothetical protein
MLLFGENSVFVLMKHFIKLFNIRIRYTNLFFFIGNVYWSCLSDRNYIYFMKSLPIGPLTIAVLLIFICSAFCEPSLGIAAVGPLTQTALKCLAQNQLASSSSLFAIIRVYQLSGTPGVDPNSYLTLINLNTVTVGGGYNIHVYM